jgi:hypothetical protein
MSTPDYLTFHAMLITSPLTPLSCKVGRDGNRHRPLCAPTRRGEVYLLPLTCREGGRGARFSIQREKSD